MVLTACAAGGGVGSLFRRVKDVFVLRAACSSRPSLPDQPEPPGGLVAFYWHFARQAKRLFARCSRPGFVVALLDT